MIIPWSADDGSYITGSVYRRTGRQWEAISEMQKGAADSNRSLLELCVWPTASALLAPAQKDAMSLPRFRTFRKSVRFPLVRCPRLRRTPRARTSVALLRRIRGTLHTRLHSRRPASRQRPNRAMISKLYEENGFACLGSSCRARTPFSAIRHDRIRVLICAT
jgi:hypothetical protein